MTRGTYRSAVLVAFVIVAAAWAFSSKARMRDFEVYWQAGARASQAEPLYRESDADYQFKYFPAFAIMAVPIAALPLATARAVWFAVLVTAFVALLWLAPRALPERRQPVWWIVAVLLVGLGKYYAEELVLGQIDILLTLVVTGAIVALNRGREALGGGLIALAVVIKPYALILAPWLVARRRGATMPAVVGLMAALLLPAAIYGVGGAVDLHQEWWRTVTSTTAETVAHSDNVSLTAMFSRRVGYGTTAAALATSVGIALLALTVVVFVARRHVQKPDGLEAAMLLALTPLISPQGWDYVLVVCTPALAWVANDYDRLPTAMRWVAGAAVLTLGLTLYDLLGRRLLYTLLDLSVLTLAASALVVVLAVLRVRRHA